MDKDTVKEVRIALIRREWTQRDLARQIGVSAAYLSLVMKGHRSVPDLEVRILEALGLSWKTEGSSGTHLKVESEPGSGEPPREKELVAGPGAGDVEAPEKGPVVPEIGHVPPIDNDRVEGASLSLEDRCGIAMPKGRKGAF